MTAREYLCQARDAVQFLRDNPSKLEAKRELCSMRARREGPRGSGCLNPSGRMDDLIDAEMAAEREEAQARETVIDAMAVLRGLGKIEPGCASVLRLRFLMLYPWKAIAAGMGLELDEIRQMASVGMDIIDANGISAIREGRLTVTGAED